MTNSQIAHRYHNLAACHVLRALSQRKLAIELRDHGAKCAKIAEHAAAELIEIAEALSDYATKFETIWTVLPGTER